MKRGFTLVELSIVLVIIGLLIGGILVAQSMISTARVTNITKLLGQFDAGTASFRAKYNALPGDAVSFGGNGDGLLESLSNGGTSTNVYSCEITNFWNNISPDVYKSSSCSWSVTTQVVLDGGNKNVPRAPLSTNDSFFVASAISASDYRNADTANPRNVYALMGTGQAQTLSGFNAFQLQTTTTTNSATTPALALSIDQKIDDGKADSGIVFSGAVGNDGGGWGGISSTPLSDCSTTSTYNADSRNLSCTPLIRIGGITGNPQ